MPGEPPKELIEAIDVLGTSFAVVLGASAEPAECARLLHMLDRMAMTYPEGSVTRATLQAVCQRAASQLGISPQASTTSRRPSVRSHRHAYPTGANNGAGAGKDAKL